MERYLGLSKIKNNSEYKEAKERLKSYIEDYNWISTSKAPLEDIENELDKLLVTLNQNGKNNDAHKSFKKASANEITITDENTVISDDERKILSEAKVLELKFNSVKAGKYKSDLYNNIVALVTEIGDYEANIEKSFFRTLLGALKGNNTDKENLKQRYVYWMGTMTGNIPGEIATQLESREDILSFLNRNYDWVNINPFENKEEWEEDNKTLMPVVSENDAPGYVKSAYKEANRIIESHSQEELENSKPKDNNRRKNINNRYNKHRNHDNHKSKEEKREIGQ